VKPLRVRRLIPIDAGDVFVIDTNGEISAVDLAKCEVAARELYRVCLGVKGAEVALIQLGPEQNTVGLPR
jgi:hypothetical protein